MADELVGEHFGKEVCSHIASAKYAGRGWNLESGGRREVPFLFRMGCSTYSAHTRVGVRCSMHYTSLPMMSYPPWSTPWRYSVRILPAVLRTGAVAGVPASGLRQCGASQPLFWFPEPYRQWRSLWHPQYRVEHGFWEGKG